MFDAKKSRWLRLANTLLNFTFLTPSGPDDTRNTMSRFHLSLSSEQRQATDPRAEVPIAFERCRHVAKTFLLFWLLSACLAAPLEAQIFYNTLTQNGEQLRLVNSDVSNNVPLQIGNLPQAANPAISPDGRWLSVRSSNLLRPNQFSTNVHVLDRVTGQVSQITDLQDATDAAGNTFNHTPRFSTFSPDGSLLVVTDFVNTATNAGTGSTIPFSFPTYSPTGGALAYFRTTSRFSTEPFFQQLPSVASLRVIRPNGAEESVFPFSKQTPACLFQQRTIQLQRWLYSVLLSYRSDPSATNPVRFEC